MYFTYFTYFQQVGYLTERPGAVIGKARTRTKLAHLEPVVKQKIQRCAHSQSPFRVVGFVHQLLAESLI
jgi:hypothetical protein